MGLIKNAIPTDFQVFSLGSHFVTGDQNSKSEFSELLGALLSFESRVNVSGGFPNRGGQGMHKPFCRYPSLVISTVDERGSIFLDCCFDSSYGEDLLYDNTV